MVLCLLEKSHPEKFNVVSNDHWRTQKLLYDTQKVWAFPFLPIKRYKRFQWLHYMNEKNHFKMLLNVFSTTYIHL